LRILFIHEVNYLTKPIFEMHEFPEHLSARGHEVFFLHFPEGFGRAQIRELGWQRAISGRVVPGSKITLLTPKGLGGGLLDRLLAAFRGHGIVRRAIRDSNPDIIVTLAVPTYGWQAVRVARELRIPIVYRALDVSHLLRRGLWSLLVKLAERYVISRATRLSANNAAMAKYCLKIGAKSTQVSTHLPHLDLDSFSLGSRARARKRLGVGEDDRVLMYMGSFFYFSGLSQVLAELEKQRLPGRIKLILVGGGELDRELRSMVREQRLEARVLFTGFVSAEELPDILKAADVLLNPMLSSLVSDAALPNKVIQYLATGLPVVSTRLKGLQETFSGFSSISWADSPEEAVLTGIELLGRGIGPEFPSDIDKLKLMFGKGALDRFEAFLEEVSASK
jgi:glycosyltransferase involved in cell wall biosynthesis